ncbi:MAG: hypothetical protein CMO01_07100 [Thalassobius sp.]|nr:hypothetical protein [Thalassovita sp.]
MRKVLCILLLSTITLNIYSQSLDLNEDLIELGKYYRNYMFRNNPSPETFEKLNNLRVDELNPTIEFIKQTVISHNDLTDEKYLKLPNAKTLKYIYIVREINLNIREENPVDNQELIANILGSDVNYNSLIDNYYDMLFSGIGNKNQPFDLSDINFEIDKYNLSNDTEKGIFFLKAMSLCGMTIWGYMNIAKPPNYKAALEMISKFPKFNSQPYYQYLDLNFPDFEIKILRDEEEMSYKSYYIDKYLNTLIYHYICLNDKKKYNEQKMDLVLGSILKEKQYYKYSKNYRSVLEKMFRSTEY